MNAITRNLALIVTAVLASVATASGLLWLEARSAQSIFGYTVLDYVPAGAMAAGLVAGTAVLAAAFLLRVRPAPVVLAALLAISAATVFLVQSAQMSLGTAGRAAAGDPAAFAQYLAGVTLHSPLQLTDPHAANSSSSSSSNPGLSRALPQTAGENDAATQSLSSGVQGVVASQDMASNMTSGSAQRAAQIGDGIHTIGTNVQEHGSQWLAMALEFVGFSLGSLLAFRFLRGRPHCDDCNVLLNRKGAQTRYFDRLEEINGSVEDVLSNAKNRRLQLSIQAHGARGAARKSKLTEFSSTIRVSRCARCQAHRLDFRAMRKRGARWKEIAVLGYSASTFELLELRG